jgi:hypothetical protein
MKRACIVIIVLFPLSLFSQGWDRHIDIHFYPHSLSPQDILRDGPNGKKLDIPEDTFLIWVDLFPGLFFAHETAYILISQGNVRLERGDWWPDLNGKMILHNELGKYALISPFELPLFSENGYPDHKIEVHIYPHELTPNDRLMDGPSMELSPMEDSYLFVWVDFLPEAFFTHPTAYVLISKENIHLEYGGWWPVLNGKPILYGRKNKTGIISPFQIFDATLSPERIKRRK